MRQAFVKSLLNTASRNKNIVLLSGAALRSLEEGFTSQEEILPLVSAGLQGIEGMRG